MFLRMNVTLTQNIVCASISITIGSPLCVGGIQLQALPCSDRFIMAQEHSSDKLQVSDGLCQHSSLLFCSLFFFVNLFLPTHFFSTFLLLFCLFVSWSIFLSPYLCFCHCVFLSPTLAFSQNFTRRGPAVSITLIRKLYLDMQLFFSSLHYYVVCSLVLAHLKVEFNSPLVFETQTTLHCKHTSVCLCVCLNIFTKYTHFTSRIPATNTTSS